MTDEKTLTAEDLINRIREIADTTDGEIWNYLDYGKLDGDTFIIFQSWESISQFNALLNGYEGNADLPNLWRDQDLNVELTKASEELEKTRLENPDHHGTIYRLEDRIKKLGNLSAYLRWLHNNGITEPLSVESFEGVESGFSDEYSKCGHNGGSCSNVVRTSPDCYSWTPPLYVECEGYICSDCAPEYNDYILEEFKNCQKSIPTDFSPADLGLSKVNDDSLENGWYGGQNDTPEPIIDALNAQDIDVWFTVEPCQFQISFDVYVKTEDLEKAKAILSATDTKLPYDPAEVMKAQLQGLSAALREEDKK